MIGAAVITAVGGVVVALIGVGGKADDPGRARLRAPASTARAPRPTGTGKRPSTPIAAQVAWTDDGGSTLLRAYDGPDSHNSVGAYPAAEHLTVTCVKGGRAVQVGAAYHGPNPNDTRWYRLVAMTAGSPPSTSVSTADEPSPVVPDRTSERKTMNRIRSALWRHPLALLACVAAVAAGVAVIAHRAGWDHMNRARSTASSTEAGPHVQLRDVDKKAGATKVTLRTCPMVGTSPVGGNPWG